jgi:hypothetical protein
MALPSLLLLSFLFFLQGEGCYKALKLAERAVGDTGTVSQTTN